MTASEKDWQRGVREENLEWKTSQTDYATNMQPITLPIIDFA